MPYTVLAMNAKTGVITEELPWETLSYGYELNDKGSWSASLPLSFISGGYEKLSQTTFAVGDHLILILRDGVLQMGGLFLTERGSVGEDEKLDIGGPDCVLGYMDMREVRASFGTAISGDDQFNIVTTIMSTIAANSIFGGITVVKEPASLTGVSKVRNYYAGNSDTALKLIDDLAATINGFDFTCEFSGTQLAGFQWKLRVGYPELRRPSGGVFALNKNMQILSYEVDGSRLANSYVARGAQSRSKEGTYTTHSDAASLNVRPQYDSSGSFPTVVNTITLVEKAQQATKLYGNPITSLTVKLNPNDPDCSIGSFRVGDEFRVTASRGRIGIDSYFRVKSFQVSVDSNGTEDLTAVLIRSDYLT